MRLTINIFLSISFVTISHFIDLEKQLIFFSYVSQVMFSIIIHTDRFENHQDFN